MKSLFNEKTWRYTDEASRLGSKSSRVIRPVFDEFVRLGFSPREISHIMKNAVLDKELDVVLDLAPEPEVVREGK